jgi:hypothetical protein
VLHTYMDLNIYTYIIQVKDFKELPNAQFAQEQNIAKFD